MGIPDLIPETFSFEPVNDVLFGWRVKEIIRVVAVGVGFGVAVVSEVGV